jgi:hypothetical protein
MNQLVEITQIVLIVTGVITIALGIYFKNRKQL